VRPRYTGMAAGFRKQENGFGKTSRILLVLEVSRKVSV
jgi:hypothetical protein